MKASALSLKEATFTRAYAATGVVEFAAQKAGFSQASGFRLLKKPEGRAAVEFYREANDLYAGAAPGVAKELLRRLMDPKTSNRDFAALMAVYVRVTGQTIGDAADKELHDMTPAELDQRLAFLRARLAAVEIDGTTGEASESGGVFD